jgi:hypothetical protein
MNARVKPQATRAAVIAQIVDDLGACKARIASLKEEEAGLRNMLIAEGVGSYAGTAYDASVSSAERGTLDMAAVREKLSDQFIRAHTNYTQVDIVKVVARKGKVFR